jgi:hypothetical protein
MSEPKAPNRLFRRYLLPPPPFAGGIVLKILPKLKESIFCRSFADKASMNSLLARVPIFVVLNEDAPVLGAAYEALEAIRIRSRFGV